MGFFILNNLFNVLNKCISHNTVYLEDTWVIKEGQLSGRKEIYTDCIQVGMITMRIILGTVTPRSKCKVILFESGHKQSHLIDHFSIYKIAAVL